ncbi:uncharacterized protein CG3556-like [Centruroides sculpturatus]|uniref:uncharacterized protein CG3556-like n=1 Tax=Centruroides sculpturatus TaxID=218467 RepID=UPI000C6D981F|nr:uncharacterized protein CG3556-like [Centruroides sculpturatus]
MVFWSVLERMGMNKQFPGIIIDIYTKITARVTILAEMTDSFSIDIGHSTELHIKIINNHIQERKNLFSEEDEFQKVLEGRFAFITEEFAMKQELKQYDDKEVLISSDSVQTFTMGYDNTSNGNLWKIAGVQIDRIMKFDAKEKRIIEGINFNLFKILQEELKFTSSEVQEMKRFLLHVFIFLIYMTNADVVYYTYCKNDQSYCKNNGKCIPISYVCDNDFDCTDGSDERDCQIKGYRIEDIPGVRESRRNGLSWLIKQRRSDWGWGKDTSRAIVTLRLSDSLNFDLNESQLMFKQLKLQLSGTLLTKGVENIEAYEIASYVHSLLAICSDPRNFQGFDLVELLKEKMEKSESINPMVALAICNSNQTFPIRQVRKLEEITLTKKNSPYLTDTRAYAIMALWCMKNRTKSYQINFSTDETFKYNRKVRSFSAIKEQLTTLQNEDGSFGNLYTTAILMHALFSVDLNVSIAKDRIVRKAVDYIISQQNQDGSFGDSLATYLILPILNRKTFVDLGKLNCSMVEPRNVTMQEEIDSKKFPKHRVSYFIFVGQDKDIISNMLLNVPVNSTFYDVMRLASELDIKFR